jgi:hypothetical protein
VTFYPMATAAFRTPLVRLPDEPVAFPFNLVRIPATNDRTKIERMVAQNRALYERIRVAGGVQYPVSALPLSQADWQSHFGIGVGATTRRETAPRSGRPAHARLRRCLMPNPDDVGGRGWQLRIPN